MQIEIFSHQNKVAPYFFTNSGDNMDLEDVAHSLDSFYFGPSCNSFSGSFSRVFLSRDTTSLVARD